jgi:hypothetical protein
MNRFFVMAEMWVDLCDARVVASDVSAGEALRGVGYLSHDLVKSCMDAWPIPFLRLLCM